jgi:MYXO-CTERM domain-containing protein
MNAAFSAPTTVACASNCSGAAYGSTSVDSLAANGSGVTYLLVGAGLSSSNDDFFKIKSLDVNTASAATAAPEPSTIQSGLLALVVGLGFAGWRRRTSRNA